MKKKRNKPGPKLKIDAAAETRIVDIVTTGGTLKDAAHIVGINPSTLRRYRAANPEFAHRLLRAEKEGKLKLIERVGTATAWQAAAWMLERKYGAEFGRRDSIKQEITGKDGGPVVTKVEIVTDVTQCAEEYERFARQRVGDPLLSENRN